jgi:hypothetical protein
MAKRVAMCPWVNYPTHNKNREIQVSGERPIVFGYCGDDDDCASCAGTRYKPNLLIQQGRSFTFVPCPYCMVDAYRARVLKLAVKLPMGVEPPRDPKNDPRGR